MNYISRTKWWKSLIFVCWYRFMENRSWLKNIGVGMVKNGCSHSVLRTLKLAICQGKMNEIINFSCVDANSWKVKVTLTIFGGVGQKWVWSLRSWNSMMENTLGQSVCRIFYFWHVWLVNLNTGSPLPHCTCFSIFSDLFLSDSQTPQQISKLY